MGKTLSCSFALFALCGNLLAGTVPERVLELPQGPGNPRNSEGSFVSLKNGNVVFIYSHYNGKDGDDNAPAILASRLSRDGGKTWTQTDKTEVPNEGGMNVMSVSLLRLANGKIALFYLRKNSTKDCRPVMRISEDECQTWSAPTECIATNAIAYYVLNNDRAVLLTNGRIVLPLARIGNPWVTLCCLSDDEGKTWRLTKDMGPLLDDKGRKISIFEPGVVELKDGRLLMVIRHGNGDIAMAWSNDHGETWTQPVHSSLKAPQAPSSIKRLRNGDLLLVWNDHSNLPESVKRNGPKWSNGRRVPLTVAISQDEGKTWIHQKALEGCVNGWYCYTAIYPYGDSVLLGYCAMDYLAHSRVTRVPISWLYEDAPKKSTFPLNGFFND